MAIPLFLEHEPQVPVVAVAFAVLVDFPTPSELVLP